MTIDFSIIPLFKSKYEIDSAPFKGLFIKSKVPSADLKQMQDVLRYFFDVFIHDVAHLFHFPNIIAIFVHEASLFEHLNVEELIVRCVLLERRGNLIISIAN